MGNTITAPGDASRRPGLNMVLWAMQGLLFLAFGALGLMSLTMPIPKLADLLTWPGAVPELLTRGIGAVEVAGAMGVFLPALVRMQPWITSYAAMGLTTVMICAVGYHMMLFQGKAMLPSIILGVIAGYVAWGRETVLPIKGRG
ncbi:MAG: DoxX family protein [Bacteroidetes bacterium]|nr:DoxX family protein [Bacteroidota bacterium]MBX7129494.1 DoxX family protein [Flavobacteriales bacterium]MCC6654576.1 DoxX family protein [Flavobacteriales bacterium]HMU13315.1 DoxX family protein [Flavobacteriales bacterium]HMZ47916.1 DoxX family protein [Flavobacteriales bacterium]